MKKLEVGTVLYRVVRSSPKQKIAIDRVTDMFAFAGDKKFKRSYQAVYFDDMAFQWHVETPELKAAYEALLTTP